MIPPPTVPEKASVWSWLVLCGLVAALAWAVYSSVPVRWAVTGVAAWLVIGTMFGYRHFSQQKKERKEESICTFARLLPARDHDTWVVRATYETLSGIVRAPVRPADDLKKDLRIDPDDLDDAVLEIARRSGRSMDRAAVNPHFDRVATVVDLIAFLEHQPKEANQPDPTSVHTPRNPGGFSED